MKDFPMAETTKKMGLFSATVIVIVNMIGTGIFLLPASMATIGSISIYGWIVGTIGATGLAIVYAVLGSIEPKSGGPYAYARDTLGPYLGFQTNYVYWLANLVGNIAIAATVCGYLVVLVPFLKGYETVGTIAILWIATGINLAGTRIIGLTTGVATVLAMVPLGFVAIGGWLWFDAARFIAGWNPHSLSPLTAIAQSVPFVLWAYMGIESASLNSDLIENPKRNVPLSTLLGLAISGFLYVATCVVLMGIIPMEQLAKSSSPFSDAALMIAGPVGAMIMAACAVLKGGSSLIGWTLNIAQISYNAARDGLFPRIYGQSDAGGVPVWNLIISGVLMSIVALATASPNINEQFNEVIDISVILVVLPYLYSTVSYIDLEFSKGKALSWRHAQVVLVAAAASIYCIWVIIGSDSKLTQAAMVMLFVSVPLYPLFQRGAEKAKSKTTRKKATPATP
jgi:arginine:agmatine antiporter